MLPTVDLAIDGTSGQHTIELVAADRLKLSVAQAAALMADLATVINFVTLNPNGLFKPTNGSANGVNDRDLEMDRKRLTWHRDGIGTSKYVTQLENGTKVATQPAKTGNGWNIIINKKIVNDAPIAKKADAQELVETMRQSV